MANQDDIPVPHSEEEFLRLPWRDMSNEQVVYFLEMSIPQPWWSPLYSGFAIRSTGRGAEVSDYVDAHLNVPGD